MVKNRTPKTAEDVDLQIKKAQLAESECKVKTENLKAVDSMLETLAIVASYHVVDEEKTLLASEPAYTPLFDAVERQAIKDKILKIIDEL